MDSGRYLTLNTAIFKFIYILYDLKNIYNDYCSFVMYVKHTYDTIYMWYWYGRSIVVLIVIYLKKQEGNKYTVLLVFLLQTDFSLFPLWTKCYIECNLNIYCLFKSPNIMILVLGFY